MRIKSLRAAALRDPRLFQNGTARPRTWNQGTDSLNPLSRYREFRGAAARFAPPWPAALCLVETEDGHFGLGMSRYAGPLVPIVNDYLAPLVAGESALATERLWHMMVRASAAQFGAQGLASYAISAVDLALWDVKGKILGRPVYELMGGPARPAVHCYATGLDLDWFRELGFTAIKLVALKGAGETTAALVETEALVSDARARLGASFDLMLDLWPVHDAAFAVELGHRLAPYDLRWIEDYLHPEDLEGYGQVRRRLPGQTLAAGERWYTERPFARAVAGRWLDILQPDVQWVGGATAVLKIAHIVEAAGLEIALHAGCNDAYGQHLCYALPGNRWGEFFVATAPGEDLYDGYRPTPGMALPKNGELVPSAAPGFGIELTRQQLEEAV